MSQDPASQLLRPYLSAWLRERIGTPELQPGAVHTTNATILYADLSGFTRLTAAFATLPDGAERLHDALNRCYTTLIDTIAAFGGDVPSIAGDALTAWWPDRMDLELARRCGQAMLAAVAAIPPLATPAGPFQLELRIGISQGMVHATMAGLPNHGVFCVLSGPALNAAAAAEREAQTGTIAVAPAVSSPVTAPTTRGPTLDGEAALSWEHFLPASFVERLRLNELSAEYRRCVPVFASFALPRRPEDLHGLVAQVQAVVLRWGGWLNEIEVGDKGAIFVLLFGAPIARGDDSSRAVGCCLELRERGLITRAGITLGILFIGAVGSAQRRVYTAQGDDMNLAAYLMQRAEPGEILVSGRIRHDVMDRYATTPPEMVQPKGHNTPLPIARVITRGTRAEGTQLGARRYLPDAATLVGRERERRTIASAAEAAIAGRPTLLLVEGESGIGKSCMLQDLFLNWCEHGYTGFSAECASGGTAMPLQAWRPLLLDLCGVDEGAPPRPQLGQLTRALSPLPERLRQAGPLLAKVLGIGRGRREPPLIRPEEEQLLFEVVGALVAHHVAKGPLLLMLEDVHWADEASLQLVAALLRQAPATGAYPLCIVLSHRPIDGGPAETLMALRAHPAAVGVTVGRLTSAEIVAMIRGQLGVTEVQDELRQHVERHTEGQPLFIKEYLRVLRQHGLIQIENGVARLMKSYVTVQISNSAQGIIQARVDRLDTDTRLTLKVAAVLGRSFSLRLLSTIHPARPSAELLAEQLETLMALQIIDLELEDPERVYRFKHGITHEVAYTSLLFGQRRQLHSAVADWYEQAHGAEIAEGTAPMALYEVLIDHLGRAEQWERQAHYCRIAAERAVTSFNTAAALLHIEQALIAAQEPEQRFNLLLLRVAVNDWVGNYANQAEDLNQILGLAQRLGGALRAAYAGLFQLRYLLILGCFQAATTLSAALAQRLRRAERGADQTTRSELRLLRAAIAEGQGSARLALGAKAAARSHLRRALSLCWAVAPLATSALGMIPVIEPQSLAARCLDQLGALEREAGQYEQALACHQQALELARAAGDWSAETRARNALGRLLLARGELESADEEARAALATSNVVGDRVGQATALQLMAALDAARGDYGAAERHAHHAVAISANVQARELEAQLWEVLADLALAQGNAEEALAARQEAERLRRPWLGNSVAAGAVLGVT